MAARKQQAQDDIVLQQGLPINIDSERFVLGSILINDTRFDEVAAKLQAEDFGLEKHRRIFLRMTELRSRDERIDRVTLANELTKHNQLEACDGLTYIVSLDDGLPEIPHIDSYIEIIRKKSDLRRMIFTSQKVVDRCLIDQEEPQEIRADLEKMLLDSGRDKDSGLMVAEQIIDQYPGGANAFLDPSSRQLGVPTSFTRFDELTGGLRPSDLIIVAGRPSMGKTALGLNIAEHLAVKRRQSVAVFSLEMSKESVLDRMLCSLARVDAHRLRLGYVDAEERRRLAVASAELGESPVWINDNPAVTTLDLNNQVRRMQPPPALVIVDYLQLMRGHTKHENRTQEVTAISRELKLLAKRFQVPVLAVSQLSRAPETRRGDNRPQLSDLRESGAIEQDADLVAFIYREEIYKPDREDLRGMAQLIIGKQRNGPTGIVNLVFLHHLTKFENRLMDLGEESPE